MKNIVNLIKNPKFIITFSIIIVLLIIAIIGPLIIANDPNMMNTSHTLKGSSSQYPLGTDEYGRCIYSRLIMGIRPSLIVALLGTAIAFSVGSLLGIIGGYFGKVTGQVIMRSMDVILSFPPILLAMMVVGMWGGGIRNLIFIIGILYIPHFTRIAYSSTLNIAEMEFVESEISIGAKRSRIILKSIFPNILASLVIQISLTISNSILLESGLSFLGLGVKPPDPSWGQMIGAAKGFINISPMYILWPSIFLSITILSINIMGDALRDILDPKLRENI